MSKMFVRTQMKARHFLLSCLALLWGAAAALLPLETAFAQEAVWPAKTNYRYQDVKGKRIFYREVGRPDAPTILLLHGHPASSHEYRELIPLLSGRYHVIAPDYLGSGYSARPDPDEMTYTFDILLNM